MDLMQYIFSGLLAVAVSLGAWVLLRLAMEMLEADRRKLQQRLAAAGPSASYASRRAITVQSQLRGLSAVLARIGPLGRLAEVLVLAFPGSSLARFLGVVLACGLVGFAATWVFMQAVLIAAAAALLAMVVPFLVLNHRRAARQELLASQLPEALDFLARVLRAGHSLSTGLQMMGDELPLPLGAEFRHCYGQHSLGQPLEDCLRELALRVDSKDFAFFVTAVLIQRQTGGDLTQVLGNISAMVRQRIRLQQHVKAITAEGRFTGYILCAFPAVLFVISYILNPQYTGILLRETEGQFMLLGAFLLQFCGLIMIRRIVAVKA